MRDIINKNVTEKDILDTLAKAFSEGFTKIKLYFMFGLPYETDEDIWAIGILVKKILDLYNSNENKIKALNLTVSASCFVPKPHTPFQFFAQCTQEEIIHKTQLLQKAIPRSCLLYTSILVPMPMVLKYGSFSSGLSCPAVEYVMF